MIYLDLNFAIIQTRDTLNWEIVRFSKIDCRIPNLICQKYVHTSTGWVFYLAVVWFVRIFLNFHQSITDCGFQEGWENQEESRN